MLKQTANTIAGQTHTAFSDNIRRNVRKTLGQEKRRNDEPMLEICSAYTQANS